MTTRTRLTTIFTALLASCNGDKETSTTDDTSVDTNCGGSMQTEVFSISREEYLMWVQGTSTSAASTTTDASSTDASTTDASSSTDASSTDASSSTASTTDASSSTDASSTAGGELPPLDFDTCVQICQETVYAESPYSCEVTDVTDQAVTITCLWTTSCIGRGHACVASRADERGPGAAAIAAWLARVAHDEAASVAAFDALHAELDGHGAPAGLLARIREAADDEVRHAASFTALARGAGRAPAAVEVVSTPARDLAAIAVENAVEGCIGETWGALEAAYAAARAADPAIRRLLEEIAADELRHAALAYDLAAWLDERLDDASRTAVASARDAAVAALGEHLARPRPAALHDEVGLPAAAVAVRLHRDLFDALAWRPHAA